MSRESKGLKESRILRRGSAGKLYKGIWSSKSISVRVLFGNDSRILLFHTENSWAFLNSKISDAFNLDTAFDIFYKKLSNERLVPIKCARDFFSFSKEEVSPCIYIKLRGSFRERRPEGFCETTERNRHRFSNSNYKPHAEERIYTTPNRFAKPFPFDSQVASQKNNDSSFFNKQTAPITPQSEYEKSATSDSIQKKHQKNPYNSFKSNTSCAHHIEHNNCSLVTENALSRLDDTLPSLAYFPPSASRSRLLESPKEAVVSDTTLSKTKLLYRKIAPLNPDLLSPNKVSNFAQTQVDYPSEAIQGTPFSESSRVFFENKEENTPQVKEAPVEPDSVGVLILSIVEKFQKSLSSHSSIDILSELLLDQILNGSKVNLALLERSLQKFKILSDSSLSKPEAICDRSQP